jgi:hypothetical protein
MLLSALQNGKTALDYANEEGKLDVAQLIEVRAAQNMRSCHTRMLLYSLISLFQVFWLV